MPKCFSSVLTSGNNGNLPAGEDAGGGEEDDGYWVGGAQQAVAVEGGRDLSPELLAQRHPGGGGQLPAIGKYSTAKDGASRRIQGPAGGSDTYVTARSPHRFLPIAVFHRLMMILRKICDFTICLQSAAKTDTSSLDIFVCLFYFF